MSFLKKLTETVSKGVSTATEKAQQTVEITKLHTHISGKRKEIERRYARIGEAVYEAYLKKDLSLAEGLVIPECDEISGIKKEIAGLEERIRELRNEKECVCGQEVPYDTKFCPSCGHKFPDPVPVPVEVIEAAEEEEPEAEPEAVVVEAEAMLVCDNCGAELKQDARFCPDCGSPVKSND
ncbi:zinc ribbon domain-containing protein [Cohnella lubricantis]|uniref:Zinc ribbon domain-containing protein n=1 Tax=Cohnella lubricantis TaxID=2163172 RepID=A0A841T8N0_9BACL|nr:zinc ribbon domain-containing protein [Cohnella lubricantis]MBB6676439.1 zinc ribbon domain-containing protein [Cohnella lubricantis]MBP2117554.1 RNA polymerase subunit RPABC4/transcription elongation factor Spt4 [Cohnella lubricantis]